MILCSYCRLRSPSVLQLFHWLYLVFCFFIHLLFHFYLLSSKPFSCGSLPFFHFMFCFFQKFFVIEMDFCFSVHWSYPHGESFLFTFYSQYIGLSLSSKLVYSFCLFVFISGTFRSAYILMILLASFESGLLSFSCYDFQSVHWSIPLCLWWILTPVQNTIRSLTPKSFAFCESKSDHWSIPFLTIVFCLRLFQNPYFGLLLFPLTSDLFVLFSLRKRYHLVHGIVPFFWFTFCFRDGQLVLNLPSISKVIN